MAFLKRRKASSSGVEASATVLGITTEPYLYTNVHGDLDADPTRPVVCGIELRVHPPGGAPYEIELTGGQARAMAAYQRGEGSEIAVRIDPDDPSVVVADEERATAAVEADLALLEAIDSDDFELPPESRWPKGE